jgi:heme/copper-type cytochrome/quinol oxidase subunit 2
MDFSAPETASILLWTLMRGAAVAVLATEAMFLWTRRREPEPAVTAGQAAARLLWAATPAVLLVGLALWCLASVASQGALGASALAQVSVPR